MAIDERSHSEKVAALGAAYRQTMIENMARVLGNRPMSASKISHQRELELWMMPTSPAAIEAFKQGGTLDEAEQANRMWAQQMKADGATDDQIFQVCQKFAYQRGKAHSQDDPEKEVAWHNRMAERAMAYRMNGGHTAMPADETDGEEGQV